jgi:hypothetical protein
MLLLLLLFISAGFRCCTTTTASSLPPGLVLDRWPSAAPRSASYRVSVNGVVADVLQHQGFSWLSLASDFREPVVVRVAPLQAARSPIASAVVRPLRHRVLPALVDNSTAIVVRLTRPLKVSIETELAAAAAMGYVSSSSGRMRGAAPTCAEGRAQPAGRVVCPGARGGVTSEECTRLGCCYTHGPSPDPHHDPWCYVPPPYPPHPCVATGIPN